MIWFWIWVVVCLTLCVCVCVCVYVCVCVCVCVCVTIHLLQKRCVASKCFVKSMAQLQFIYSQAILCKTRRSNRNMFDVVVVFMHIILFFLRSWQRKWLLGIDLFQLFFVLSVICFLFVYMFVWFSLVDTFRIYNAAFVLLQYGFSWNLLHRDV